MWLSCGFHVVFMWLLRLLQNLSRVFLWDKKRMWFSCGFHVVFMWFLRLLKDLSRAFLWDKKRMWFSCGFHVVFLLWDAQRTDSAHPGQLVIRFSHMSEAPTNIYPQDMGTLLHLKTQQNRTPFFFIPKFKFLSLLLQFFRMLCLRCSAPRPYFVSRPLLPHALCHMDSLLQKPLCSIAIIASETPRATWIAQSCACFENSSQRPPSCHFASPRKHCLRSGAGVIGFFDMCWVMVQLSIQDMFAKSESLLK